MNTKSMLMFQTSFLKYFLLIWSQMIRRIL